MSIVKRTDLPIWKQDQDIVAKRKEQGQASSDGGCIIPFEILGESINPLDPKAPFVLQGTFIQVTNLTSTPYDLFFEYFPTSSFLTSVGNNIALAANVVYVDLDIYDVTKSLAEYSFIYCPLPAAGTIIVGVEYAFAPSSGATQQASEAGGNRGSVTLVPFQPSAAGNLLVTTTIRQSFVTLSPEVSFMSSSAYSVPVSTGPLFPVGS